MPPSRDWPHIVVLDPYAAGLAFARSMVRLGAAVTMLVDPSELVGDHARHIRSVVAPFEPGGAGWLETLREIAATEDEALLFPATDRSCGLLLDAAHDLPTNLGMFERLGSGHYALMDKLQAEAIARDAGARVPWTASVSDLAQLPPDAPWPCVVKPAMSHEWRARYGAERVFLVSDADEARARLVRPLGDGLEMLLSQYIPGEDHDVEEAIVVRLDDGSYPVRFGCQKLRQFPRGFGITTVGEASELPETMGLATRVLDEAGFVGVAGVETKRHTETGERWFLEVNVRIPGQWGLGDACGVDASRRLVRALWGRPLGPQPPLKAGVRIVIPEYDAQVVLPALRQATPLRRPAVAWQMLQTYRGARNFGVLDLHDPAPGFAWASRFVSHRVARLRARLRRR